MALKMLRENRDRFDLVISDVHMPDMDGFKLLELVGLEMDLPVISKHTFLYHVCRLMVPFPSWDLLQNKTNLFELSSVIALLTEFDKEKKIVFLFIIRCVLLSVIHHVTRKLHFSSLEFSLMLCNCISVVSK